MTKTSKEVVKQEPGANILNLTVPGNDELPANHLNEVDEEFISEQWQEAGRQPMNFVKPGDLFMGYLMDIEEFAGDFGTAHIITVKDPKSGNDFFVVANNVLYDLVKKVPIDSKIAIMYTGDKMSKKFPKPYKTYRVKHA